MQVMLRWQAARALEEDRLSRSWALTRNNLFAKAFEGCAEMEEIAPSALIYRMDAELC